MYQMEPGVLVKVSDVQLESWLVSPHKLIVPSSFKTPTIFLLLLLLFSHVWLFTIPWTVACQASLFIGFSRQEYWSGLPFPSAGDLPNQGANLLRLCLLHGQADSLLLNHLGSWNFPFCVCYHPYSTPWLCACQCEGLTVQLNWLEQGCPVVSASGNGSEDTKASF